MKWSGTIIEIYRFQQRLCCVQNLHFRMKDPVQAGSWNGTQTIDKYLTRKMSRKECKVGGGGLSRQQCQISISQSPAALSRKSPESAVATIAMSRGRGTQILLVSESQGLLATLYLFPDTLRLLCDIKIVWEHLDTTAARVTSGHAGMGTAPRMSYGDIVNCDSGISCTHFTAWLTEPIHVIPSTIHYGHVP